MTGVGAGAGVSTITGAGVGRLGDDRGRRVADRRRAVVSTVAGDCVTTTFEMLLFLGIRLTFVFVPRSEPLPLPPAELLV